MDETLGKRGRAPVISPVAVGAGQVHTLRDGYRLTVHPGAVGRYNNAQLDDYRGRPRRAFSWQPPLFLTLAARFSHPATHLQGTAGFGFWNDPFLMTGRRTPTLPRAVWFFFASPPSNMQLALDVPGWGWKAAVIDALRTSVVAALPAAPVAATLFHWRRAYRTLWPVAQRLMHIAEANLAVDLTTWHRYSIAWSGRAVTFAVDGEQVLHTDCGPCSRLGLVIWIDNQYMVATPQGRLRHGVITASGTQWMEIRDLGISGT